MTGVTVRPGDIPVPPWGMSTHAAGVYRTLGPTAQQDPQNRYTLAALLEALTWLPSLVHDAAMPEPGTGETPWAAVVDPWRCPWWALRWCGQIYGLRLSPDLGAFVRPPVDLEQAWRQQIADRASWRRGHPDTIIAAARRHMVPDGRVVIRERYSPALGASVDAPYHHQVRIRRSDVLPGVADETVVRTVLDAIPIGRVTDVAITDDRDWDEVVDLFDDWDAVVGDNLTWDDLVEAD